MRRHCRRAPAHTHAKSVETAERFPPDPTASAAEPQLSDNRPYPLAQHRA